MTWRAPFGTDGFDCAYDPFDPEIAYATAEYGRIFQTLASGSPDGTFRDLSPEFAQGVHLLPGKHVAIATLQVAIDDLLARYFAGGQILGAVRVQAGGALEEVEGFINFAPRAEFERP